MPVSATESTNTAASTLAWGSPTTTRTTKKELDSQDFMKLLAVQFQSQDPMKPMEDTAFIAQMAQFSALEQSTSLVSEMALLRADQQNLTASSMLGRTVTVEDADGLPVSGTVSAIENTTDGPVLVIDDVKYPLSSVTRVEYTPTASASSSTEDLTPAA